MMAEENKVRSKTDAFKAELQARIAEVAGIKVSKQAAWDLFKALVKEPFKFILKNYDAAGRPEIRYGEKHKELELPLSGVGTFKVITTGKAENTSVRGRYYLSSSIDRAIAEHLGFAAPAEDETGDEPADEVPADSDLEL
jgi:hypothetical protein